MNSKLFQSILVSLAFLALTLLSNLSHAQTAGPILCDKKKCADEEIAILYSEIVVTGSRIPFQHLDAEGKSDKGESEESKDVVIKGSKIAENNAVLE